MMRKLRIILTGLLLCTLLLIGSACGDKTKVTVYFTEWEKSVTASVEAGEEYRLDTIATDDTGKTYNITSTKITQKSDNAEVKAMNFAFLATDPEGYTIVYTVEISAKEKHSRTVDLQITDNGGPVVNIGEFKVYVGEEATLPEISIRDVADPMPSKAVKIYQKDSVENTVTITDDKFTIESIGEYTLEVTATDKSGNSTVSKVDFWVDYNYPESVLLDGTLPSAVSRSWVADGGGTLTLEYVEASGEEKAYLSLKVEGNDTGNTIKFNPVHGVQGYTAYDYVKVEMMVVSATTVKYDPLPFIWGNKALDTNAWHTLYVPYASYEKQIKNDSQVAVTWLKFNNPSYAGNISEIRFGKIEGFNYANLSLTSNSDSEYLKQGDTVSVTVGNPQNVDYAVSVKDENGDNVTYDLTNNVITFTAALTGEYEISVTSLDEVIANNPENTATVLSVYVNKEYKICVDTYEETGSIGTAISLPTASVVKTEDGSAQSGEVEVTATYTYADGSVVEVTGDSFTPTASGTLTVSYTFENALDKTAVITVEPKTADSYAANVLLDVSTQDAILRDWQISGSQADLKVSYVAATQTEGAYIKLDFADAAAAWRGFYFAPIHARDSYSQYDFIKITAKYLSDNTWVSSQGFFGLYSPISMNEWVTFYVPYATFATKLKGNNDKHVELCYPKINDGAQSNGNIKGICVKEVIGVVASELPTDALDLLDSQYGSLTTNQSYATPLTQKTEGSISYWNMSFENAGKGSWPSIRYDLSGKVATASYTKITMKIRYNTSAGTPQSKTINPFEYNDNWQGMTTDTWYTATLEISKATQKQRTVSGVIHFDICLGCPKVKDGTPASDYFDIQSVDIAELYLHN